MPPFVMPSTRNCFAVPIAGSNVKSSVVIPVPLTMNLFSPAPVIWQIVQSDPLNNFVPRLSVTDSVKSLVLVRGDNYDGRLSGNYDGR